jgi:hypothetical protein
MSAPYQAPSTDHPGPQAPKVKRRRKVARRRSARPKADEPVPRATGEFAGITEKKCPTACTPQHCVISTVAVCKHPVSASVSGCGRITLANRERAMKVIKRQKIGDD